MRIVFADSAYWIALLNRGDRLHEEAVRWGSELDSAHIVTTEMVLTEVLNHFSRGPTRLRQAASALVNRLDTSANKEVIPQTTEHFRSALDLYKRRDDKHWSLTDCASILIMQAEDIQEVLTHDAHFTQAGFTALLRDVGVR